LDIGFLLGVRRRNYRRLRRERRLPPPLRIFAFTHAMNARFLLPLHAFAAVPSFIGAPFG
jgi:hypothetical protein